jgi:hypothetical protein
MKRKLFEPLYLQYQLLLSNVVVIFLLVQPHPTIFFQIENSAPPLHMERGE